MTAREKGSSRVTMKRTREILKELFGDGFIVAFGGWFLFIFVSIEIYGQVIQLEKIVWIRRAEMAACVFIMAFGVERFISDIMKGGRGPK